MIRRHAWLGVPLLAALLCGVLSLAIDTQRWVDWFGHPLRDPVPDVTRQGAVLWRIMLSVCAAALVVIPAVLECTAPPCREAALRDRAPSKHVWALAALVAIALLVRATRLGESLWYDEISAWFAFGIHGPGPIMGNFFEPANHVAHTLLCWCSVSLFTSLIGFELALRLPALLLSLAAVVAVYGMARCVLARPGAFVATVFAALGPVAVLEGVEARGYSMMICAAALAHWAFLANVQRERAWTWCVYAAICAVGAWAHFVTVFVPIGHAAWLGWRAAAHGERGRGLRGGLALLLAAAVTVTLYAPIVPELLSARQMYTSARGDEPRVLGAEGWHALLQLGGSWYAWAAWPGLLIAALGLVAASRIDRLRAATAVTLLGLPLFVLTVLIAGSWLYARFALFALPGAGLLLAIGFQTLWRWRPAAALAGGTVILAASAADLAVRPPKQPLRDAARLVRERAANQPVLVVGLAHQVMDLYLLPDVAPHYSLRHGADLAQKLRQTEPAWIIVYYANHVSPEAYTLLDQDGYVPVTCFPGWVDWDNGDVCVYAKELAAP